MQSLFVLITSCSWPAEVLICTDAFGGKKAIRGGSTATTSEVAG